MRYFNIIKEKLKERGADYKVLYAFSDFVHPETNAAISEHAVNELKDGELIEDRFEGDDYRLMVVANKFQTGFDQPLLAGMFLDKPRRGPQRRADRVAPEPLPRGQEGRGGRGFHQQRQQPSSRRSPKYRKGTPFEPEEPDQELCPKLHAEILAAGVFTQKDAARFREAGWRPARMRRCSSAINALRDALSGKDCRSGGSQGVRLSAGAAS